MESMKDKSSTKHFIGTDLLSFSAEILSLSLKPDGKDKMDQIIRTTVNGLYEITKPQSCFFAVLGIDSLHVQEAQYLAESKKPNLENIFNEISKKETSVYSDSFCILPVMIQGKIVACLYIETNLNDYQKELNSFADILSSLISQNQFINDIIQNNEKLLGQEELKAELMSTISHELKTPMANILGFSEMLSNPSFKDKIEEDKQEKYLTEIYKSAKRLNTLIDNFLDLSKIENTGILYLNDYQEVELDWLAQEAWKQLAHINQEHQIKWQFGNLDKIQNIYCDNDAVLRVFINLFNNAIKYSKKDSKEKEICCRISFEDSEVKVEIEDNGIGINAEDQEKIFNRFFRSKSIDNDLINGTGLGLWICKEIIEAHEGRIWCESQEGIGAKFSFILPI